MMLLEKEFLEFLCHAKAQRRSFEKSFHDFFESNNACYLSMKDMNLLVFQRKTKKLRPCVSARKNTARKKQAK
jgi:hypothetical protein